LCSNRRSSPCLPVSWAFLCEQSNGAPRLFILSCQSTVWYEAETPPRGELTVAATLTLSRHDQIRGVNWAVVPEIGFSLQLSDIEMNHGFKMHCDLAEITQLRLIIDARTPPAEQIYLPDVLIYPLEMSLHFHGAARFFTES
jgi:hypothetical protein